ncbi:MAG: GatB/YqeY domain-containing protein [Candidatus Atribacteria bacterium]|nr:GatB/YqeY domain-containing protein [Candidatus Atribacteria bacterium]
MSENISLESRIFRDYQKASKEGRKVEVSILRIIRAEIKNSEIRKKEKLTDEEIQKILNSLLKKEEEALSFYIKGERANLVEKTKEELDIIKKYLPEGLSLEEIENISREIIVKNNFGDMKDFSAAIKLIMKETEGRADGKLVSAAIGKILKK